MKRHETRSDNFADDLQRISRPLTEEEAASRMAQANAEPLPEPLIGRIVARAISGRSDPDRQPRRYPWSRRRAPRTDVGGSLHWWNLGLITLIVVGFAASAWAAATRNSLH